MLRRNATLIWQSLPQSATRRVSLRGSVFATDVRDGKYIEDSHLVACRALPGDELKLLQEKNRQLRSYLATMQWPRLTSFEVDGRHYHLPWKPESQTDVQRLATHNLDHLAGFFDGDGCVRCLSDLSGCELTVGQVVEGAPVLLLFQDAFGGSICRHSDGLGLCQPVLVWRACGPNARWAASALACHSIVKRRQLKIAAEWPTSPLRREDCKEQLAGLKQWDSAIAGGCCWQYFAGFFDAEGYIQQLMQGCNLQLSMCQKFVTVLECLQGFLSQEVGVDVPVHKYAKAFTMTITTTATSKLLLERMLSAGLVRKAAQAKLALTLGSEKPAEVRHALGEKVGNQKFGKRLDDAGVVRARKIQQEQRRARRLADKGSCQAAGAILTQVEALKLEHALLNAQHENCKLLEEVGKISSLHK